MKIISKIVITMLFVTACGVKSSLIKTVHREGIPIVSFCDLPDHKGELVYVECVYSGVEEYWSLSGDSKCKNELDTELTFKTDNKSDISHKYKDEFKEVHNNYFNTYLQLKIIGRFDNSAKAYGHLGGNNSEFRVEEVVELKVVKK